MSREERLDAERIVLDTNVVVSGLVFSGFVPAKSVAKVLTLEGVLDARNTASTPEAIKPAATEWKHGLEVGETTVTFPAHSFTVIRL